MKKLLVVLSVLFAGIVMFSCSDMTKTPGAGNGMRVPEFIGNNSGASRLIDYSSLVQNEMAMEMYYSNFCPAIISFKEDDSVSAGDSFTKTILGVPVEFQTSVNGNEIIYSGSSNDKDIIVSMKYNTVTNVLSYEQCIFAKNGGGNMCVMTKFTAPIVNEVIHTKVDYNMVFAGNSEEGKSSELNYGDLELYISDSLVGFCVLNMGYAEIDKNMSEKFEVVPNEKEAIKNAIDGIRNMTNIDEVYFAGKLVNGVLDVHLGPSGEDGKNGIMSFRKEDGTPDRAAAQEYCPWTLFPLDN